MNDNARPTPADANEVLLLAAGTEVFALVEAARDVPVELRRRARPWGQGRSRYLVPIRLHEDLLLVIEKPNRIELKSCKCSVFLPEEQQCISLNHACTSILRAYKPHMNAFSGNAFHIVRYERVPSDAQQAFFATLAPLSKLREEKVNQFEASLRFRRAIAAALSFHREQTRKGGTVPYISHVLAVTSLVQEHGGTDDEAIAALLHDAVDNGGGWSALEDISRKFSAQIANIVEGCADSMEFPKPPWKERKEAFLRRLPGASASVRLVVAADKLHNARALLGDLRSHGDAVWHRFDGGKDGTLWYYRSIAETLKNAGPHLLAAELGRVAAELEAVAKTAGPNIRMDGLAAEARYQALLELTGLEALKELVDGDVSLVLHNQRLRSVGVDSPGGTDPTVSLVLTGNPGTGKTKVARLLGAVYKSLGLLTKGHVVEVSRADLVGDAIGATEKRTLEAIAKAKGGFLFIDEAYSLAGKSRNDFGVGAIEVLLKAMSDSKGDFGVIVAGYPEPMREFLESNPGLRSRFLGREVLFEDYTPPQLLAIATETMAKLQLTIDNDARESLSKRLEDAYRGRDATFGNARYAKGIVSDAKAALARRLRGSPATAPYSELVNITLADVEAVFRGRAAAKEVVSIDEESLAGALADLDAMAGIPSVKQEVAEIVDLVRYYRAIGKSPDRFLNSHFVFIGNPGTGKTTVARILGRIYRALGLLARGHLVECDRQALIAQWVGQTAVKTSALIDKAMGGMLFIDEAYTLVPMTANDFGPEAVQVLLKRMEDQRGQFVVVVAGYPEEMEQFLASNPGLKSRFDTFLAFEDYGSGELLAIAERLFVEEGLCLDDEARRVLCNYCSRYVESRDRYSGNARDVRTLVQKSVRNQNLRVARARRRAPGHAEYSAASAGGPDTAETRRVRAEDLSSWTTPRRPRRRPIGFLADETGSQA